MKYEFDSNIPIYLQLEEVVKKDIIKEKYKLGEKIPSVRELALLYSVNPNTVQKALQNLEKTGIIKSERAVGRFVSEDKTIIKQTQDQISMQIIDQFINQMHDLNYDNQEIIDMLTKKIGNNYDEII